MLNPNDPRDRAKTALTCSWIEKDPITNETQLHTNSFDCWGDGQAHQWHTTTPRYAIEHAGLRSHITLAMLKDG